MCIHHMSINWKIQHPVITGGVQQSVTLLQVLNYTPRGRGAGHSTIELFEMGMTSFTCRFVSNRGFAIWIREQSRFPDEMEIAA